MVKRINAFRSVFNLLLTIVELIIGVCFLIRVFGSSDSISGLVETVQATLDQMGTFSSPVFSGSEIERPVAVLVLVLGFMLLGFVLITIVPAMVEKKEREMEFLDEADDY